MLSGGHALGVAMWFGEFASYNSKLKRSKHASVDGATTPESTLEASPFMFFVRSLKDEGSGPIMPSGHL